jgi:acetylornithine deacetylase/succinyl-diaminopimelate desuccinylase-like protein
MADIEPILALIDSKQPEARARLCELLRIPSISAQPDHAGDCVAAAAWVRVQLAGLKFDATVRPTAGHPVVVGHHPGPGGDVPHLLF